MSKPLPLPLHAFLTKDMRTIFIRVYLKIFKNVLRSFQCFHIFWHFRSLIILFADWFSTWNLLEPLIAYGFSFLDFFSMAQRMMFVLLIILSAPACHEMSS